MTEHPMTIDIMVFLNPEGVTAHWRRVSCQLSSPSWHSYAVQTLSGWCFLAIVISNKVAESHHHVPTASPPLMKSTSLVLTWVSQWITLLLPLMLQHEALTERPYENSSRRSIVLPLINLLPVGWFISSRCSALF